MYNRISLALVIIILAAIILAGCGGGGSKSQHIGTPWDGTIVGVDTLPPDDDTGVDVTTWIKVYWPDRYFEPSQSFTFKLYGWINEEWTVVKTIAKDNYPEIGTWWFAPENDLAYDTDYRIVVTDDYGDSHTHYFTTESGRSRSIDQLKRFRPEGGGKPGGVAAEEQRVVVQ